MTEPLFTLREETPDDLAFTRRLFREVRGPQFAMLPLPEDQKAALLDQQHDAQRRGYANAHPGAQFLIVERAGEPVGRLCLAQRDGGLRVLDIAFLESARGQGIGRAVLEWVRARAGAGGVSLSVSPFNPARRLYERLGFAYVGEHGPDLLMAWTPS